MTKIVMWVFHMDDSTERVYGLIPGRYYLTALGLTLKLSNNTMSGGDRPFKGCTAPMVNLGKYNLKKWDTYNVIPEEYFMGIVRINIRIKKYPYFY